MQHLFDTPEPTVLFVEFGSGDLAVHAGDADRTVIDITGPHADEVVVEQRGHEIVVIAPRRVGFLGARDLHVVARVPTGSELVTQLGSADLTAKGTLGRVKLASGSGDVTVDKVGAEAQIKTGSGHVEIDGVGGAAQVSSGSGDIEIGVLQGPAKVSTGSGDIEIDETEGPLTVKSGSGNLDIGHAAADTTLVSGSGKLTIGRFPAGRLTAKNASGDIRVGIPAGVPVWTDITSISGRVHSSLTGAGEAKEGQPYVELRATTVSGDVVLNQL